MDVAVVIIEQLDSNGMLRTFCMQADYGDPLIVAFADEYEEFRNGPFHFLNDRREKEFQKGFAECKSRKVSSSRFSMCNDIFHFVTSWVGIPTERQRLSYYAICLPEHAIPITVKFTDSRSRREYKKAIIRDDQRQRFILYLECRCSRGTFDFALEVDFRVSKEEFALAEFRDENTTHYRADVDAYEYLLLQQEQIVVQQYFSGDISMGDQYNVTGQIGAIGRSAKAKNNTFNQVFQQAASEIDLSVLASELATLRSSLRQQATEIEHDQAVACIGAAESAAKKQDGAGALSHLKSAGMWTFDVATKIGTTVAASAIQTAMGL
ncbi:hypothetical protein [Comamonas sp.]|uniref:hypothetical protein n=1 Tax=Comamonas sp. TaxID=34028 RepID=UPI0028A12694|nr:hypothetical protein [Comamonas sp.]